MPPSLCRLTLCAATALSALAPAAHAADWSDTYMGYRYGTKFAEPFNPNDIAKNILNLNHASGYKYGSNFFNVDLLMSDEKDPSSFNSTDGAQEAYIVYRNTVDLAKVSGKPMNMGFVRGWGLTAGFDWNTKTDVGYNSKKRMLVLGPTMMVDVPGFLNISLVALWESNQPSGKAFTATGPVDYTVPRYRYDTHGAIFAAWGIPLGQDTGFSFEGFANFIASKGKNEFGADTAAETNIDMQVMYDIGRLWGTKGMKLGFEYQYWKNKFGNDADGPAGDGAFAKTPMIRFQYHF